MGCSIVSFRLGRHGPYFVKALFFRSNICHLKGFTGKLILNMMVSVAQFEREMMKERRVEGIKRAQAEGKYKGRVPTAMKQADKVAVRRDVRKVCFRPIADIDRG